MSFSLKFWLPEHASDPQFKSKVRKRRILLLPTFSKLSKSIFLVAAGMVLFAGTGSLSGVQDKRSSQVAGVDNSKMGAYRALAELSYQAFQKGDTATAAKLSRILERTWDKGEQGGGKSSLTMTNAELFEQIDSAMDGFIKPLIGFEKTTPDPAKVAVAYAAFLEKLKQAD
jgi:hypothetical protein